MIHKSVVAEGFRFEVPGRPTIDAILWADLAANTTILAIDEPLSEIEWRREAPPLSLKKTAHLAKVLRSFFQNNPVHKRYVVEFPCLQVFDANDEDWLNLAAMRRAYGESFVLDPAPQPLKRKTVSNESVSARRRERVGRRPSEPCVLLVTHDWGGGVERHIKDQIKLLQADGLKCAVARPAGDGHSFELKLLERGKRMRKRSFRATTYGFVRALLTFGVTSSQVHHLAGFHMNAGEMLRVAFEVAAVPYDVFLHDYMFVCPRITPTTPNGRFCGTPDLAGCERCIAENGSRFGRMSVETWRNSFFELIVGAQQIIAPSDDVRQRFLSYYASLDIVVRPHTELAPERPLKVVTIGYISIEKGAMILDAVAEQAAKDAPGLQFVIIGDCELDILHRHKNVQVLGKYEETQLPALLRQVNADVIWFPGLCPETYSYTLSRAFASGLPIVAFDIGAIAERMRLAGRGVLLPIDMGEHPDEIVYQLDSVGLRGGAEPSPQLSDQGISRLPSSEKQGANLNALLASDLEPLFWTPQLLDKPSSWWNHVPFAFWIVVTGKPQLLVELGTGCGVSYAAFCEAVARSRLKTRCYAVDTWTTDVDADIDGAEIYNGLKEFHDKRYASFSELLQMNVDDASRSFDDGTVDLLHIDAHNSYDAVRNIFEMWRPKLSARAIVLFHHTNIRNDAVGVWRFFEELKKELPSFEFLHGRGLGVALVGIEAPEAVRALCGLTESGEIAAVCERFLHLGTRWTAAAEENSEHAIHVQRLEAAIAQKDALLARSANIVAHLSGRCTATKNSKPKKGFLGRLRGESKISAAAFTTSEAFDAIRNSVFFDADFYLETYPDVKAASIDPAVHYFLHGGSENRNPGPHFSTKEYLEQNPDVAAAGLNALAHYELHGRREGRPIRAEFRLDDGMRSAANTAQIGLSSHRFGRTESSPWSRLGRLLPPPFRFNKSARTDLTARNLNPDRETILVLAHEASRTGAPILAWNLVCEFSKRYNVVVLLRRGGAIQKAFDEVAAAVVCFPDDFPLHGHEVESTVKRLVKDYSPIYAIANSVETRHFVPDLERMGVPVVALVHEFSCYCWPLGTLNSLYETASRIVFSAGLVAENSVKDYRSLDARDFKILPQGQSKLPPGTDALMTAVPTKADVKGLWPKDGKDSFLVVGMGTIQIRKGIDFFISTAAIVHRAMPNREIRFAWIGKCYPHEEFYFNFLKQQVERSGLSDTFAFVEEVDDLQPIFDQADIYFLSSRLDPLPNVAIDSALNGIPIVCFEQASGMPEILAETPDTRELVVPHLDAGAAAMLICDLVDAPERLTRLSKAIRSVAEARFDMARYVEAIDELGRDAKAGLDQLKRDHTLISQQDAFNADLYLGSSANKFSAGEGLAKYLNISRLAAPRQRPRAGLFLRRPLEGFHPLIYAEDNPQYDETTGEDPLAHYIRTGEPVGRWKHEIVLPNVDRASAETALSVAVHGHFHYPELLPDFIKRLKSNAAAVDFYLTTTSAAKATEIAKLATASGLERTKIIVVPNRGRDTGPMLSELGDRVLSGYDIVGHFHGKRSPQFDAQFGDRWRNFLWEHLVGGEFAMMDVVLGAFARDEGLGLVFAEDPHLIDWDENRTFADEFARRMGLALPLPNHFDFPMGSMFWARTAALKPLFDLGLTWDDYPEEPLPADGTVLHALERLIPFCAGKAGYRYATTYVKSSMR
jgi:glycosyltransferase involved in cell wall biosynthesis